MTSAFQNAARQAGGSPLTDQTPHAPLNVLITGGRRVGADLARRLAGRRANVAMTWHTSRTAIEAVLDEIRTAAGVRTIAIPADLADPVQASSAVAATVDAFGRIDALANMASIFPRTPFAALKPDDFDRNIAANLAGPYHTAVAAGQAMLKQTSGTDGLKGRIVNVGDWAVDRPYRDYLPYLVAKGGLKTLTLALAVELAPHVAVNMIQPAMIAPPTGFSPGEIAEVVAATPLRRVGQPSDVNELILYLLTATNFVTGTCIRVDGGRFLGDGGPADQT